MAPKPAGSAASAPGEWVAIDHPGRWVGGAIGALASLVAALLASRIRTDQPTLLVSDWLTIGLLGIPIGFALGRQFLPATRSGGWGRTLLVGAQMGLIAPPIGAIEFLLVWGQLRDPGPSLGGPGALVLLPFAIPLSYVAVVMTVPVGIASAIAGRWMPAWVLERLEAPASLARYGIRHALIAAGVLVGILEFVRVVVRP